MSDVLRFNVRLKVRLKLRWYKPEGRCDMRFTCSMITFGKGS